MPAPTTTTCGRAQRSDVRTHRVTFADCGPIVIFGWEPACRRSDLIGTGTHRPSGGHHAPPQKFTNDRSMWRGGRGRRSRDRLHSLGEEIERRVFVGTGCGDNAAATRTADAVPERPRPQPRRRRPRSLPRPRRQLPRPNLRARSLRAREQTPPRRRSPVARSSSPPTSRSGRPTSRLQSAQSRRSPRVSKGRLWRAGQPRLSKDPNNPGSASATMTLKVPPKRAARDSRPDRQDRHRTQPQRELRATSPPRSSTSTPASQRQKTA